MYLKTQAHATDTFSGENSHFHHFCHFCLQTCVSYPYSMVAYLRQTRAILTIITTTAHQHFSAITWVSCHLQQLHCLLSSLFRLLTKRHPKIHVTGPCKKDVAPCSYVFLALTLKHRETHGCVVSTVATDALVLKHQAISIHNAD